jgi:two-component system cell cycle sensor histidine kinase/response regulator CckA
MSGGGTLSIRTENATVTHPVSRGDETMPPGEYVLIQVGDTGHGIPTDILDRIFEPFFSTKEVGSGTGLGLSTVYGIVKQTGGFIFVESKLNEGATFSIYLPRYVATGAAETARVETVAEGNRPVDDTGIGTVLLVEDEDAVRLFGARALRNKGYKVLEARSGEAALEIINGAKESIDLLITDVVMPRMDGPALIKEVRQKQPNLKVIFISGYAEDNFRRRLDENAEIHFLAKPFSLKQLAGKVKEVMREGSA